jgi:phage baseplate assembly protein W
MTAATLGVDIGLTLATFAGGGQALEVADSWGGLDLGLGAAGRGIPGHPGGDDLTLAAERANLGQALILRLLTPLGSLSPLGHPNYGSRLTELIGERNDETHRNLARLYTIQAVAQERRAVLSDLAVDVSPDRPDVIRIAFSVLPVGSADPLDLAVEVTV